MPRACIHAHTLPRTNGPFGGQWECLLQPRCRVPQSLQMCQSSHDGYTTRLAHAILRNRASGVLHPCTHERVVLRRVRTNCPIYFHIARTGIGRRARVWIMCGPLEIQLASLPLRPLLAGPSRPIPIYNRRVVCSRRALIRLPRNSSQQRPRTESGHSGRASTDSGEAGSRASYQALTDDIGCVTPARYSNQRSAARVTVTVATHGGKRSGGQSGTHSEGDDSRGACGIR